MYFTHAVTAGLALAGSAIASPAVESRQGSGLARAMRQRGRSFIGTAVTFRDDPQEAAIYGNKADFNSITPENAMKWESTEPTRGNFTLDDAQRYIDYAQENKIQIHCHTLVWHSQLPPWVTAKTWTKKQLKKIMREHINGVAGAFKGQCTRWDVVNEALNEDGTYRSSVFYDTLGEDFIPLAFKYAAAADPNAKLFYNDYNLEYNGAKTDGAQRIVNLVKSRGLRIDGVGFQAHLTSEPTESSGGGVTPSQRTMASAFRKMTTQGVDVAYTEIDVRMNTPSTPAKLEEQAAAYRRIAASCLAVKRCIGMTIWGVSDKYSWIPGVFEGEGEANLWNENYNKKPAYYGFLKGIQTGGK